MFFTGLITPATTFELFNARYLHYAETTEDLYVVSPDIHWVSQRGTNMTVIYFIDRVSAERTNTVTRLGNPFPMRDREQATTPLNPNF